MPIKLSVIFYSMYGHVYKLSEAVIEGACSVQDVQVNLYRVPEIMPDTILEQSGARQAQAAFAHVPTVQVGQMHDSDGFIFGAPTRFGNMCVQMRTFLERLDTHYQNTFVNKIGSAYTSPYNTQETTIPTLHASLLKLGMVIVGLPKSDTQVLNSTALAANPAMLTGEGKRMPTAQELDIARLQGKRVAETTKALKQGRSFV